MYEADLNFNFTAPTKVIYGPGSIRDLPMEVDNLGTKVVLVTDKGLESTGIPEKIRSVLGNRLILTYNDIPQDTGMEIVDDGAALATAKGVDVVVSIGGGSVMDTAKGMCIVMKEGGSLRDYEGMQMLSRRQTPHIAIPTTAGTGSEVTSGTVVLDAKRGQKLLIFESFNTPQVAILDPELTVSLPPGLTASTGMDAMTHAIEAFVSVQRNPISDAAALRAIRLIFRNLEKAVLDGSDILARGNLQIAALLAGWAFNNALLGLVHAMAHSVGAVAHIPHGLANSIILPHVMEYNLDEVPVLYAEIAEALECNISGRPEEAGQRGIEAIRDLTKRCGLPSSLSAVGLTEDQIPRCADLSMSDGSIVYNPKMVFEMEDVISLYRKAF